MDADRRLWPSHKAKTKATLAVGMALVVLGFTALIGNRPGNAYAATAKLAVAGANAAPSRYVTASGGSPWIDGSIYPQQSSARPGGSVPYDFVMHLTDYYKAATSNNGIRRVLTVVHLPAGTTFARKAWVHLIACRGVPSSWCKLTVADKKVVVKHTTSGVTLTWNMYHVRMRPESALRFWPKLPNNASGQYCVSVKATPYGAGNDPLGHPAQPYKGQACVQVTGSSTTTSP